jgi:hypothetical protein
MKVSGVTIIRNAVKLDYPIVEAITSVLPLCDEFIVGLGDSDDATEDFIRNIFSDKVRIVRSVWDMTNRVGGSVLAVETNKALDAVSPDTDWCFYIQADECVHEQYLPAISSAMKEHLSNKDVEGLVFKYLHFYGSYDYVADSRSWYRTEVRVIRNDKSIRSHGDAQGFRKNDRYLQVKPVDAYIYHYGWVKHPKHQQQKAQEFNKLWHDDKWIEANVGSAEEFDYSKIDSLDKFIGIHPKVMQQRILSKNWDLHLNPKRKNFTLWRRLLFWIEKLTGWRPFEYKRYKIV